MPRYADMASPEIPTEEPIISRPKLAYRVGKLAKFTLPPDLSTAVAATRVSESRLNGKKITINAGAGIEPTELERAVLTWIMAGFCGADSGGKQWRAVLPLTPKTPTVFGQVIFAYDADLNATATLVERGLPIGGPASDLSNAAVIGQLIARYKLAGVTGAWQPGELLKISRALALLTDQESATLEGVALERVADLGGDHNGHTEAKFNSTFASELRSMGTISVADLMFAEDVKGFYGGADGVPVYPPSFQSILHEVGHVIESAQRRATGRANALYMLAKAGSPTVYTPQQTIPLEELNAARKLGFTNIAAEQDAETLASSAYDAVGKQNAAALIEQCRAKGGVLTALADRLADYKAGKSPAPALELIKQLKAEEQKVVTVFKFISQLLPTINTQPDQVTPDNFPQIRDTLNGMDHQPWLTFYQNAIRWADVQERAAKWRAEYKQGGKQTTGRLRAFIDYVKAKEIPADLTLYAGSEWPANPDELYCEGFGIWKVDPVGLAHHSPDLVAYFKKGTHLEGT
jgi:hypothetical protein